MSRDRYMAPLVAVVDGLPGCGKTLMTAIVSALERVELLQYSFHAEYACALKYLGRLDADAARVLIRLTSDEQLYDILQSRKTNFRWADLSSVRRAPTPWRYIRRLFTPGDGAVLDRIELGRPVLHLVTHFLAVSVPTLLSALEERLRFIEVLRHPLYMLKQQFAYMPRWGTDVRDFTVWFDHDDRTLPWFAYGWEAKYATASPMDQAIYMIEEMWKRRDEVYSSLTAAHRQQVLMIPFEPFVTKPARFLAALERLLGTRVTRVTKRELKRQRVPRQMYAEGIPLAIYKQYGWQPPVAGDEAAEFDLRRRFVAQHASPAAMATLDRLCAEYERDHLTRTEPLSCEVHG